jgi:integrase
MLRHFQRFCDEQSIHQPFARPRHAGDLEAINHNEEILMMFAVYLVRPPRSGRARTAATALAYCSHLRSHVASALGFTIRTDTTKWRRLVKAISRQHTRERRLCKALRATHLRHAARGHLAHSTPYSANLLGAVTVGWHVLARPQELVNLRRSDLQFVGGMRPHAILRLRPLKKAAHHDAVPIIIAPGDGGGADAYAALRRLETSDPVHPSSRAATPLFRVHGGRRVLPLTSAALTAWVRHVAKCAGENQLREFTGRSLRVGGATDLAATGAPEAVIRAQGRWSSTTHRAYTRMTFEQAHAMSARLTQAASDPTLEAAVGNYTQRARW